MPCRQESPLDLSEEGFYRFQRESLYLMWSAIHKAISVLWLLRCQALDSTMNVSNQHMTSLKWTLHIRLSMTLILLSFKTYYRTLESEIMVFSLTRIQRRLKLSCLILSTRGSKGLEQQGSIWIGSRYSKKLRNCTSRRLWMIWLCENENLTRSTKRLQIFHEL